MEVVNALIRNTIDYRRADLIIRALHIAVKNVRRARFNATSEMVKEVPDYGDDRAAAEAAAQDATFNEREAAKAAVMRYVDEQQQGLSPKIAKPQPQDRFTQSANLQPQIAADPGMNAAH